MDVNRAKEIIDSPLEFKVQLDGKNVWLESVDATTKTATVHKLGEDEDAARTVTVRVDQLEELGPM